MTLLFEHTTCPRCTGTGRFGPMSVQNGVCFKCGGACAVLTKRGHAAQDYYYQLTTKPAGAVVVGDRIEHLGITAGGAVYHAWSRVVAVSGPQPSGAGRYQPDGSILWGQVFDFTNAKGLHWQEDVDASIRCTGTAEQQAQALAYQATLTATGTVRKRAVAS